MVMSSSMPRSLTFYCSLFIDKNSTREVGMMIVSLTARVVYSNNQYLLLYCGDKGAEVAMIRLLRVILTELCTQQGSLKPLQTRCTSLYTVKIADNSFVSLLSCPRSPVRSMSVVSGVVPRDSCLSSPATPHVLSARHHL